MLFYCFQLGLRTWIIVMILSLYKITGPTNLKTCRLYLMYFLNCELIRCLLCETIPSQVIFWRRNETFTIFVMQIFCSKYLGMLFNRYQQECLHFCFSFVIVKSYDIHFSCLLSWIESSNKNTGVLLAYSTTAYFQHILLKNDPFTNTVNEENGRVF